MSRLIRWGHLADTARVAVLWYDDRAGRTQRTEVCPLTLERLDGEPLAREVRRQLAADHGVYAFYAGVLELASEVRA